MGMFNNYADTDIAEEAACRAELVQILESEPDIIDWAKADEKPIAKISHQPGFYSTTCPACGKSKILSSELNTMTAVCNKCYCAFKLVKDVSA